MKHIATEELVQLTTYHSRAALSQTQFKLLTAFDGLPVRAASVGISSLAYDLLALHWQVRVGNRVALPSLRKTQPPSYFQLVGVNVEVSMKLADLNPAFQWSGFHRCRIGPAVMSVCS